MFGQYQCHRLCFSLMTFQTFLTISEAPTISIKYTPNIAWRHFTSYQFFPSDWYNLNLSQEKKYWRVNRRRRLNEQILNSWHHTKFNISHGPEKDVGFVDFVYSVGQYNQKSKDCLKHCFKFVLKVNSFSKPVYIKNLFEVKSHFHRNGIQNKQN